MFLTVLRILVEYGYTGKGPVRVQYNKILSEAQILLEFFFSMYAHSRVTCSILHLYTPPSTLPYTLHQYTTTL